MKFVIYEIKSDRERERKKGRERGERREGERKRGGEREKEEKRRRERGGGRERWEISAIGNYIDFMICPNFILQIFH